MGTPLNSTTTNDTVGADCLRAYGWNDFFISAFENAVSGGADANAEPARVIDARRDLSVLITRGPDGAAEELEAVVSGKFRAAAVLPSDYPTVGDWVLFRRQEGGRAVIDGILPRRTTFSRKAPNDVLKASAVEQVLAANVDLALVVMALNEDYSLRRVERYLTLASEAGVDAAIVLSKADLCDDPSIAVAETMGVAGDSPVLALSALTGEGMSALDRLAGAGRTVVLLGSSGAGKSTLLNALAGRDVAATGAIKAYDGTGRHTTTSRSLKLLGSGALVIDTPGLREVQLYVSEDALSDVFKEIEALAESCRFRDCGHGEEPGCAVRAALETGELSAERFGSWLKLRAEIRWLETKASKSAAAAERVKWKAIAKLQRTIKPN